ATMVIPGGGERTYTPDNVTKEYYSHTVLDRLTDSSNALTGFAVSYANAAKDYYTLIPSNRLDTLQIAFLTAQVDSFGHSNRFVYLQTNNMTLLKYVVDADGRTNTLTYTNSSFPSQITGVQDPFGAVAIFQYDSAGMLTNVTDPISLASSFKYDSR